MLIATPANFISRKYAIEDNGEQIAHLNLSWFRERGQLEVAGRSFDVGRESILGGTFFLDREGDRLVEAVKRNMFVRRFTITAGQRDFTLEAAAPIARTFHLIEAGKIIGEVRPKGFLSQTAIIDLPEDLPMEVRLFMTWLVLTLWKRANNSSS